MGERIGRGSFSEVFEGIQTSTGAVVAIKHSKATCDPRKLTAEMTALRKLRGRPYVVQVLDAFRIDGCATFVFQRAEFTKFSELIATPTSTELIRSYMHALLLSLNSLHELRLVHRDVKPGNFLYCARQGTGVLCDFGLTMHEDALRNAAQVPRCGTAGFKSPESLLRWYLQSTPVDVWAAGVILLSLITSFHPFISPLPGELYGLADLAHLLGTERLKGIASSLTNIQLSFNFTRPDTTFSALIQRKWPDTFARHPPSLFNLLDRCLEVDPRARTTVKHALSHPFFCEHGTEQMSQ